MYETPYYTVNYAAIKSNYRKMVQNMDFAKVHYALKPNSEIDVLQALISSNANFEIVSNYEMDTLIKLGAVPQNIICSLPIKKAIEVKNMYQSGCRYFTFDSKSELVKLIQYAPTSKKVMRIYIADITEDPEEIELGITMDDFIKDIVDGNMLDYVDGVTFHILSNDSFHKINKVLDRASHFISYLKLENVTLNIGGNYRLVYEGEEAEFYNKLALAISSLQSTRPIIVYAEPGRAILKNAIELVTTVLQIKKYDSHVAVYIDASSQIVKIQPKAIEMTTPRFGKANIHYIFYENLCSHYKLFEISLPYLLKENDILRIKDYGHYSICFANKFHGALPPKQYPLTEIKEH